MNRFILFILLFPFLLSAQDRTIDSLKLALKIAKNDTMRCIILSELAEITGDEEWPAFNEQLLKLSEKNSKTTPTLKTFYLRYYASALNNVGFLADQHGDIPKALEYYQKSLKIKEEIKDKNGIANTLNNIGSVYNIQSKITEALVYFKRSLKIQEEIKNKLGIAQSLMNIGVVVEKQGDISQTLDYYHKGLKIYEEINDKSGIAYALNNIGIIYYNQGDRPKALDYYEKSLKLYEEVNDKSGMAYCLNNIGEIYRNQGNATKALEYYQRSIKLQEEIQYKYGMAMSLNNIGLIYKNQGNIPKALEHYNMSLKLYEEINDLSGIAYSLNNTAWILFQQGNLAKALDYAIRSLQAARKIGYPENIKRAAGTLNSIYKKQNKFKEAFEMYELEIQMRDSINNETTKKASIKKQFQYEYEKKAAADSVKHFEEQKVKNALLTAQQAQLKQEKTQRLALYGGLVLVIAFLGFVFNRFRVTQKQKVIIEQQKVLVDNAFQHLEEKNKEVLDSIRYAKRIQTALLTNEKYIDRKLNELN